MSLGIEALYRVICKIGVVDEQAVKGTGFAKPEPSSTSHSLWGISMYVVTFICSIFIGLSSNY